MQQKRSLGLALAASLLLVAALVAPTQAAPRKTSAQVFSCPFGVCMTTSFAASWSIAPYYAEGHYEWEITQPWLDATVGGGGNCLQCDTWYYGADMKFYNAAGVLLATVNPTNNSSCGHSVAINPTSVYLTRCQSYAYAPFTATKLKIHWRVDVTNCCGWTVNSAFEKTTGFIAIP